MPLDQLNEQLGQILDWQESCSSFTDTISDNEIHLWKCSLILNNQEREVALSLLNDVQTDRYHRRSPDQKDSYLASRYFLYQLLASYTGININDISFIYSRLNKPSLNPNPSNLFFNYTDTVFGKNGIGLYAFTLGREIGIDIEYVGRKSNFSAITARRFCPEEIDFITNNGAIDPHRFLACWTRKEAYGKATGKGINFKMNDINLSLNNDYTSNFKSIEEPPLHYHLQQLQIEKTFVASVVTQGHENCIIHAYSRNKQDIST